MEAIPVNLQKLLENVDITSTSGARDLNISGIAGDHRKIQPGYAFICYEGISVDGHTFISQAIQNGAVAIIGDKPPPVNFPENVTYIQTSNGRIALSRIAANWHGNPAEHLKLIGITGTNGKTSTAHFAHAILTATGLKAALIGTVGHRYGDVYVPPSTTTPDPIALHALFRKIVDAGLDYVVMETSSQGLAQHRLAGLTFETAVFTNLTQDHLDYHETMEAYFNAKLMLFQQLRPKTGRAILNADDPATARIRETLDPNSVLTYGIERPADLTARDIESTLKGLEFTAITPQGKIPIKLRLLGDYNLYNALAAIGVGLHHGCSLDAIQAGLHATIVPGRFELVDRGQSLPRAIGDFAVVVDYAHTPDGLENLLTAARKVTGGRLICVFGCGGDRDRTKRPKMGKISTAIADHSVITSDNPRTENPNDIIADIIEGVPSDASYDIIPDRREAIGYAIGLAKPGDLVAIAGKGHEDYQEINGQRFPFDDRTVAATCLEGRG
jgi:UDP-N-acetylmuramoyl-L-alanyl-D-glutamate--2,6-diaminopimelate ligase